MSEQPPFRGRSPGTGWRRVTFGIHVADDSLLSELSGWQLLLPAHGCFTHLTGAKLRGWWLPPVPAALPVFVSLEQSDPRPLRPGVHTTRLKRPCAFDVIDGLRVASPPEVLLACAQDLGLVDLVVLLDGAAHAGDIDLDELRALVSQLK